MTDPINEVPSGRSNRILVTVLIVVVVLAAVPAVVFAAVMLTRSDGQVQVDTADSVPETEESDSATDAIPTTTEAQAAEGGEGDMGADDGPDGPSHMADADDAVESVPFPPHDTSYINDIRIARHDGFDRVVFAFDGEVPGYRVEYLSGPMQEDGSGREIPLEGTPLNVIIAPASGFVLEGDEYKDVFDGPDRIDGTGRAVTEIVDAGDFEGQLTFGIGVDGRRPFKVFTLTNPSRVVVDIKAG